MGCSVQRLGWKKRKEEMEGTWEEPGTAESERVTPIGLPAVPVAGWPLCALQNRGRGERYSIATGAAVLMSPQSAKQRTGP